MTRSLRLLSGCALLFLASAMGAAWDGEPLGISPVAAAQATPDVYRSVYEGWKWWHVYCYRCHGVDALGGTTAPNLTEPNRKLTSAAFLKTVRDGIPDKGMQAWDKLLDRKQIGEIYVYVRARADKVLPAGRPDEVGPNGKPWIPPPGWSGK